MSVEREMSLAEWCAKLPSLHLVNQELSTLTKQLAALAEQNAQMRGTLDRHFKCECCCLHDGDMEARNRQDMGKPGRAHGLQQIGADMALLPVDQRNGDGAGIPAQRLQCRFAAGGADG